jgi:ubiquitin C-terminal hydrolase
MGHYANYTKHSLVMNVKTQRVYCYGCRDEIAVDEQNPAFTQIRECAKQVSTIINGPSDVEDSEIKSPDDVGDAEDAGPVRASFKETGPGGLIQGVKGLRNVGNTCFYNSIMQNVAQTVPLRERFVVSRDGVVAPKLTEGPTSSELRQFMTSMWNSPEKVFSPVNLLNAIGKKYAQFRRRHQQDSHELLMCLLDLLSSEEKKILEIIQKAKSQIVQVESGSSSSESPQTNENDSKQTTDETNEEKSASESLPTETEEGKSVGGDIVPTSEPQLTPTPTEKENNSPSRIDSFPESASSDIAPTEERPAEIPSLSTTEVHPDNHSSDSNVIAVETSTSSQSGESETAEKPNADPAPAPALALETANHDTVQQVAPTPEPSSETTVESPNAAPQTSQKPAQTASNPNPSQWAKMLVVEKILSENGIDKIFGGELESRITCHVCENRSTITEPFNNLSLQIPMKMMSDRFRQQLGLGSSGKRGKVNAAISKEKEREYPMRDEGAKMSKKQRAEMFRLQQERDLAEKQAATSSTETVSEPQPEPNAETLSPDTPTNVAETLSTDALTNVVEPDPKVGDADGSQNSVPADPSPASETAPGEDAALPEPTPGDSQPIPEIPQLESKDTTSSSDVTLEAAASNAEAPVEVALSAPSSDTAPSEDISANTDQVDPEPSTEAPAEGQEGAPEEDNEYSTSLIESDDDEPKADPEEVAIGKKVEGHSNVYDGRRVAEAPPSGSLESCLYSFTDAELIDENNMWGCYHCTRKAWVRFFRLAFTVSSNFGLQTERNKDIFDLVLQNGTEVDQRAILIEKELIPHDADRATFLAALKSSAEKSRKRTKVILLKRRATKQFLINHQPRVLALHLKRFMQISATKVVKLDADVSFPPTLDINPYATEAQQAPAGKKFVYKLYGISSHSGGMGGGHYVAYTRRRPLDPEALANESVDQDWYYYSDTQLQATSLKAVLRQEAYVLFYERVLADV